MSSMMVAPRLQMSDAGSAPLSEMTSGATASEREREEKESVRLGRGESESESWTHSSWACRWPPWSTC